MNSSLFALIALVVVAVVTVYNGLVSKRNMVRNAFSSVDVNLRKRHNLISNLVETVRAYAKHEQETLTAVIEATNRAASSSLTDPERFQAEAEIGPGVQRLIALSESYPDLQSNQQFFNLQRNLSEIEEQISAARRAYNADVLEIKNAVETFPSNLFASAFGFFEASVGAQESIDIKL